MSKYRNWLLGLGIGLILGASMLQVILIAKDQTKLVEEPTITREQLDEEAKKAGLLLLSTDQLNAKVNEAVAAVQENEANVEPEKINDTKGTLNPPGKSIENENTPQPSEPAAESSNPETTASQDAKEVTLYIPYKMTLSEVASELQKLGVIDDVDDFVTKAWAISKKLTVGTSVFKGKPTYKQIMTELTRKKED